jgi:hypothetical protein
MDSCESSLQFTNTKNLVSAAIPLWIPDLEAKQKKIRWRPTDLGMFLRGNAVKHFC